MIPLRACSFEEKDTLPDLKKKRIVVTAPVNYAHRFAGFIKKEKGIPVVMPAIETVVNPDTEDIDQILDYPAKYDWVVLPSRKAIDSFFKRVEQRNTGNAELDSLQFLAIGKDMDYLAHTYNRNVAFVPDEPSPKGITASLSKIEDIDTQSIVVVAPRVVGLTEPDAIPEFLAGLEAIGMKTEKAEGYITRAIDSSEYNKELALIRQGKIDLIAFTSTAEIESMINMLGGVEYINKNNVACFGPYTAANARKLGVEVEYTGQNFHSFKDFVAGIKKFFHKQDHIEQR